MVDAYTLNYLQGTSYVTSFKTEEMDSTALMPPA